MDERVHRAGNFIGFLLKGAFVDGAVWGILLLSVLNVKREHYRPSISGS